MAKMFNFLKIVWKLAGSINLTIALLMLLVFDLSAGFICLKSNLSIFIPLNDVGLIAWLDTYGINYLQYTAWFFLLLVLLFLLAVNTFVCTTDKVVILFRNRFYYRSQIKFILNFAPHIIHYAFVVILAGYLVSYIFAVNLPANILLPEKSILIPGTGYKIKLNKLNIEYYKGQRLNFFQDRAINPEAEILLTDANGITVKKTISVNRPARFKGYSIHLEDFAPKSRTSMQKQKYVNLIIHNDPGIHLYFCGMFLFVLGMLMYLYRWYRP
ncbi:MAG: cytochrome c biogenesis protein ResB [Deltaproteobacteria bacterium]|nr:cytochrome c biogenesis protein ResB [Deltaproteobacteria bacterium]